MSRWFRMYDELLDDPKVQRLGGEDFKAWVNILCLASRDEGFLPSVEDIGFALRLDAKKAAKAFDRLRSAGLIAEVDGRFMPHKWAARQYKSDVSTDRVKRFRERSKRSSETPPDTETDTDTETEVDDGGGAGDTSAIADPWDAINLTDELCRIVGVRNVEPTRIIAHQAVVREWLAEGIDPDTEIIPALRQAVADSTERISSLAYFANPVRQFRARKEAQTHGHEPSRRRSGADRGTVTDAVLAAYDSVSLEG